MIETHAHLYVHQFQDDIDNIMLNAKNIGVEQFFLPAIDSKTTQSMLDLEQKFPKEVRLMMGLHPCSVHPSTIDYELGQIRNFIDQRPFSAIGEIGIDLYWDKTYLELQKEVFSEQIMWAKEKKMPIVIHSRNSFDEVFSILDQHNDSGLYGIFHCFTGNLEQAKQAISYGMKLGIGGIVTFKNGKINTFLDQIDLKHIVLETDSPYLAPTPFRGKRNEPSYLKYILNEISSIYRLPEKEIDRITTKNALEVFHNYQL